MFPLSADEYARAYYPKYTPPSKAESEDTEEEAIERRNDLAVEEDVMATIAKLDGVKLINLGSCETWPSEYGRRARR